MKRVTLLIVLLIWSGTLVAQTISGIITDKDDGGPVSGAIIHALDKSGKTLSFVLSDSDGRFDIPITQNTDTVKITFLGYKDAVFGKPFKPGYQIQLESSSKHIKESIITAPKVLSAHDTLSYNINALKREKDVVLSDVLERIPGLTLDELGFVRYNGRPINRFYIDGKDIVGNNYNLVSRNIDVDAVKSVEVLERHQPIRIFRGVKDSDKAALNILLNEDAKAKVNWNASASLGLETDNSCPTSSARLSAIYAGNPSSSTDVIGFDNQGYALRKPDFSLQPNRSPGHFAMKRNLQIGSSMMPLDQKRSLFNQSWEGSSINHISLNETSSISISINAGQNLVNSFSSHSSRYQDGQVGDTVLNLSEKQSYLTRGSSAILSFTENGERLYFSDNLYADYSWDDGSVLVSGGLSRLQQTLGKEWTVENDASVCAIFGNNVLSFDSFSQFSGIQEGMVMEDLAINEVIRTYVFHQKISVSGIGRNHGNWRFSLTPNFNFTFFRRRSCLEGFITDLISYPTDGNSESRHIQAGTNMLAEYKRMPLCVSFSASVYYDRFANNSTLSDALLGNASASIKYITGRSELSARVIYAKSGPEVQDYGENVIMTGYNSLWKGQDDIHYNPFINIAAHYIFREPVSGWNTRISSSLAHNKAYMQARDVHDLLILSFISNDTIDVTSLSNYAELNKGIFAINGNVRLFCSSSINSSSFLQNGRAIRILNRSISPGCVFSLPITLWWGTTAKYRCSWSSFVPEGVEASKSWNMLLSIKQSFSLSKSIILGLTSDLYYYSFTRNPLLFPDVDITWKNGKGFRIIIEANNLLNNKAFSYQKLFPLLEETFSYKIRPLSVLTGVEWRF